MPTVTLQPAESTTIDTFTTETKTTDRSTSNAVRVGWDSNTLENRALFEFDLSQVLPKSTSSTGISSVTLTLKFKSALSFPSSVDRDLRIRVIDGAFEENATWEHRDGSSTAWASAGGDVLVTPGTQTVSYTGQSDLVVASTDFSAGNLLHFVRDAIANRGMKCRLMISMVDIGGTNRYVNFHSSNASSSSDYPKLEITYTGVPGIGFKTVTSRLSSLKRRKRAGRKK